jgi:hypothetical protein
MAHLNKYSLTRTDEIKNPDEDYEACIVLARSIVEAKRIHPLGKQRFVLNNKNIWVSTLGDGKVCDHWTTPENLNVSWLGPATEKELKQAKYDDHSESFDKVWAVLDYGQARTW